MKDLIHIGIGQAGLQISEQLWQNYVSQHFLTNSGKLKQTDQNLNERDKQFIKKERQAQNIESLFIQSQTKCLKYSAKSLLIDSEPSVIDQLKKSNCKQYFNKNNYISWKQDSASNYANGYYHIKRKIQNQIEDRLRKISQACDNIQTFIFNNSLQGGTGSSISVHILQKIAQNYPKKAKINFVIFPSPSFSNEIVGPYNSVLSLSKFLQLSDLTVTIDNQSLYRVFKQGLDFDYPSYANINKLISQVQSSFTLSMRYKNCKLNCGINQILTNLVAYPRIHFAFPTFSPINLYNQNFYSEKSIQSLLRGIFDKRNQLITNLNQQQRSQQSMLISSTLLLRGDINQMQVYKAMDAVKTSELKIADWCPTPIKIGIHHKKSINFLQTNINQKINRSGCSLTSSFQYHQIFGKLNNKFDLLYTKRGFVHWLVGQGLEEGIMSEARQDLAALEKDYEIWQGCCQQYQEQIYE